MWSITNAATHAPRRTSSRSSLTKLTGGNEVLSGNLATPLDPRLRPTEHAIPGNPEQVADDELREGRTHEQPNTDERSAHADGEDPSRVTVEKRERVGRFEDDGQKRKDRSERRVPR